MPRSRPLIPSAAMKALRAKYSATELRRWMENNREEIVRLVARHQTRKAALPRKPAIEISMLKDVRVGDTVIDGSQQRRVTRTAPDPEEQDWVQLEYADGGYWADSRYGTVKILARSGKAPKIETVLVSDLVPGDIIQDDEHYLAAVVERLDYNVEDYSAYPDDDREWVVVVFKGGGWTVLPLESEIKVMTPRPE